MKTLGALAVIAIIFSIALLAYEKHEDNERKNAELKFATEHTWKWHDEYNRIQSIYDKEQGRSILRKININNGYVVYAQKTDKYALSTLVQFVTECKPGKKIETSKKYSDGTPIILLCNNSGTALTYKATWDNGADDFVWNEEIDGFKFYVNFADWDFSKLDQEVTLSKAK